MSLFNLIRVGGKLELSNFAKVSQLNNRFCSTLIDQAENGRKKKAPVVIMPLETCLKYMDSNAYTLTYGSRPVWEPYRRNHKGQIPPKRTRKTCIWKGVITTGNPCPICRDEYLLLHEKNPALLKQFISENTGQILGYGITGLCQTKHRELVVCINRARDQGIITFDVPFREYDYSEYLPLGTKN